MSMTRRGLVGMAAATGAAALTLGGCGNAATEGPLTFANLGNEITLTNNQNAEYAWRCDRNVTLHRMAANVAWCIQKPPANGALAELLWSVFVTRGGTHPQANGRINQYGSTTFDKAVENNAPRSLKWDVQTAGEYKDVLCTGILKSWVQTNGTGGQCNDRIYWAGPLSLSKGDYIAFYAAIDGPAIPIDVEFHLNTAYA